MPAINFSNQFFEKIQSGAKTQTIRKVRTDGRPHCRVGDVISLYTGMRTKQCQLIALAKVKETRSVIISDGSIYSDGEIEDHLAFAQSDGFDSVAEFNKWFADHYGLPFHGVLIKWELKK
ncbi:MAG: hypothetical protein U5K75_10660 [Ahrensia sp.]|nr:hypothetical protein [Ahrensia sp.]